MLVLSRKVGQKLWIGDNICVEIVDNQRGKIRIGITCPREIPVFRNELLTKEMIEEKEYACRQSSNRQRTLSLKDKEDRGDTRSDQVS